MSNDERAKLSDQSGKSELENYYEVTEFFVEKVNFRLV